MNPSKGMEAAESEINRLRAALAEKEKDLEAMRTDLVATVAREVGLREERDAIKAELAGFYDKIETDAFFGLTKQIVDDHTEGDLDRNDICSIVQVLDGTYRTAMKEVAAQAQEIKELREEIASLKREPKHMGLMDLVETIAAKDRIISEQAAVIERARQGVIIAIEFVEGKSSRSYKAIQMDLMEILSMIGASTLGDAEPALTSRNIPACSPSASESALPAPQPAQEKPCDECHGELVVGSGSDGMDSCPSCCPPAAPSKPVQGQEKL